MRAVLVVAVAVLSSPVFAATDAGQPSAPSAKELLAGCQSSPIAGGSQFACDGVIASISEYENVAVKDARDSQLAGITAAIKGQVTTKETVFTASGKSWSGVAFTVKRLGEDKVSFEGTLLGFEVEGVARLVFCGAAAKPGLAEKCRKLLPVLADEGPKAFAAPVPDPEFAGKKVTIPAGCKTVDSGPTNFRIICGQTAFLAAITLRSEEDMPKILQTLRDQLVKSIPGAAVGKERECSVGGVATKCTVVSAGSGKEEAIFFLGSAVVKGVPVSVQCAQTGNSTTVHEVCRGVLDLPERANVAPKKGK